MKKLLIIFLLCTGLYSFAQENIIKIGLAGLSYGDYSIHYERVITPKSALNFTVGYLAPKYGLIQPDTTFNLGGGIQFSEFKTGFHASVDYKFYVGKKDAPRGLYVAPYVRYFNYSLLLRDDIKKDFFDVNTNFSSFGAGFQLGYHWLISDRVSIDWSILGIGVEYLSPKLVYTIKTPRDGFEYESIVDDIQDVFTGWTYFEKRLKTTPSADNTTAKLSTIFPGFKMGLSIGYAF